MTNTPEGRSRREVIGIPALAKVRRSVAEPTDEQLRAEALRWANKRVSRRRVLQGIVIGYAASRIPVAIWELAVGGFRAKIGFLEGQKQRLRNGRTDSLTLVFGGANTRSADKQARPIANELAHLGAVGYVKYANNDIDIKGIADKIQKYERKYSSLKEISIYGVSLGAQVAAGVLGELETRGSKIKLQSAILDSTPPDISYTVFPFVEPLVKPLEVAGGSTLLTMAANYKVWGHPFEPGSTPPRLLASQGVVLEEGIHYMQILSRIVRRDHAKVAFLTAQDKNSEGTTDPVRSERRLKQFFPGMDTFKVGGSRKDQQVVSDNRQGHGNPDQNGIGYRAALQEMLRKWKIIS